MIIIYPVTSREPLGDCRLGLLVIGRTQMASIGHVRGALLEEALLHLLWASGYDPVTEIDKDDPTLAPHGAGIAVKGRGGKHQIDAIADLVVTPPFCHPMRLLLEAKCVQDPIGLPVVRNQVGVLKDVSEFWVLHEDDEIPAAGRYHYQTVVASASGFTGPAQRYAFAQDVSLISVANQFMLPVVDAIVDIEGQDFGGTAQNVGIAVSELRTHMRGLLAGANDQAPIEEEEELDLPAAASAKIETLVDQCNAIGGALLTMLGAGFPMLLAPAGDVSVADLDPVLQVRIRRSESSGWTLNHPDTDRQLFSFDVPEQLLGMYMDSGRLTARASLNLKLDHMQVMRAIARSGDSVRLIEIRADLNWLYELRRGD